MVPCARYNIPCARDNVPFARRSLVLQKKEPQQTNTLLVLWQMAYTTVRPSVSLYYFNFNIFNLFSRTFYLQPSFDHGFLRIFKNRLLKNYMMSSKVSIFFSFLSNSPVTHTLRRIIINLDFCCYLPFLTIELM